MYFFNINSLIVGLKVNKVSQRDGIIYVILLALILLAPILLLDNSLITFSEFPDDTFSIYKVSILILAQIAMCITALLIFFHYNRLSITNYAQLYKDRSMLVKFASIYVVTTLRWFRYVLLIITIINMILFPIFIILSPGQYSGFVFMIDFMHAVMFLSISIFSFEFLPFISVLVQLQFFWRFIDAVQQLAGIGSAANKLT